MSISIDKYPNQLLFIPLGGSSEIGMNLNVYSYNGKIIIVDMGIGFAEKDFPGIDVILPLPVFLERYQDRILGLVLTHAHEDHMGALPYLWNCIKCPVYTTRFTKYSLESKLCEFDFRDEIEIHEIKTNERFTLEEFDIEFVNITHSIPEMQALMIRTPAGNVFHTGDWKFDKTPVIGDTTNTQALERIGREGVLAMVCDSTNIFHQDESGSEGELQVNLCKLIKEHNQGLVCVTTFASNIARLYSIGKAAKQAGRRVIMAGRSLWRLYNIALECGYMRDLDEFLQPENVSQFKREEMLFICTGSQGELLAAVNKIAADSHPDLDLHKGDLIIFSSKIIPGNEKRIYSLFNKFCKKGVKILTEQNEFVHVSGHPSQNEVRRMYDMIKPQVAIPVHGEAMHLHKHCEFAAEICKIKHTVEVENGAVIALSNNKEPQNLGSVECGYLGLDGGMLLDEFSSVIKDRRSMRDNGLAVVILMLDQRMQLIKKPHLLLPGIIDMKEDNDIYQEIVKQVMFAYNQMMSSKKIESQKDNNQIKKSVIKAVKKFLKKYRKKSPQVIVHIERIKI